MATGQNTIYRTEVLTGLVQDFKYAAYEGIKMMPGLPENKIPGLDAEWDTEHQSRELSPFNVPGNEAHKKAASTYTNRLAKMMYVREKTPLSAPTIRMLRMPGGPKDVIAGEARVRRELQQLDNFVTSRAEWAIWQMFSAGTITYSNNGQIFTVTYGIPVANLATTGTTWADYTNSDPVSDLDALQQVISRGSGRQPTDMWITRTVNNYMLNNAKIRELLRNQDGKRMLAEGKITRLLDMDVHIYDNTYKIGATTYTFIPVDNVIMLPKSTSEDPIFDLMEGGSQDLDAPAGHRGKFSKMWIDKDPSVETVLSEWAFLPILKVPAAVARLDVVP